MQLVDSNTTGRAGVVNEAMSGAARQTVPTVPTESHTAQRAQGAPASHYTQPSRHEGGHPVWRIACGDMINRERSIAVFVDDGEVVVVGPPGESARLAGAQINELKTALGEAAKLAGR